MGQTIYQRKHLSNYQKILAKLKDCNFCLKVLIFLIGVAVLGLITFTLTKVF